MLAVDTVFDTVSTAPGFVVFTVYYGRLVFNKETNKKVYTYKLC